MLKPYNDTTMAKQTQSPLLRLPPELRNRIYNMVLENQEISLRDHYCAKRRHFVVIPTGLLLACHQTYKECIEMFYSTAMFTARADSGEWLADLPRKYARLLRSVTYDTASLVPVRDERYHWAGYLPELAERTIHNVTYALERRGVVLREGTIKASIRTCEGNVVWTSTPMATYKAQQ